MPPHGRDDAVEVLLELPGEPALAYPAGPDDRDEPGAALPGGGVEEVLQQAQLVVAADERRFERPAPTATAAVRYDAKGKPGRHGCGLALQLLLAGRPRGAGGP